MNSPSIEAVNLSKRYGSFLALSNLSLKIEGSKCVGFLGPNGAGKTTTLKIFTDIRGLPRAEKRKKIEEVVSEVKMEEWLDKKVGKFSKGMKQRINIAAALLSDPDVFLLDEPTTGLDPRGMAEVRDIVKSLKTQNRLIFMSSHLLNEVQDVCDEVAMIDHGKLLVYDSLSNVTSRASSDGGNVVEIELLRDIEERTVNDDIASLANVSSAERPDPRKIRIHFSGGVPNQERLLLDLANLKIGMISFHPSATALEDTYLRLIKDTL